MMSWLKGGMRTRLWGQDDGERARNEESRDGLYGEEGGDKHNAL